MSYLLVLDKELMETIARMQPLKSKGEQAMPKVGYFCSHDCRDTCGGGCGPTFDFGASNY
jgi:hypothetical protein